MTTQTFEAQVINEDDLKAVQGGGFWKDAVNFGFNVIPGVGLVNKISQVVGGPTVDDLVE